MGMMGGCRATVWAENPGPGGGRGWSDAAGAVSLSCGSQVTLSHATCSYSALHCQCYSGGYTIVI